MRGVRHLARTQCHQHVLKAAPERRHRDLSRELLFKLQILNSLRCHEQKYDCFRLPAIAANWLSSGRDEKYFISFHCCQLFQRCCNVWTCRSRGCQVKCRLILLLCSSWCVYGYLSWCKNETVFYQHSLAEQFVGMAGTIFIATVATVMAVGSNILASMACSNHIDWIANRVCG